MDALCIDVTLPRRDFDLELELTVEPGLVALAGPSGAGKTSLLRAIAGLERPVRGRVEAGGAVWFDHDAGIDLPPEERSVGMVFQDYALFPHMTVKQNVAFGARVPVGPLLERLRLGRLADQRPTDLSGGERQRVAVARALAMDPRVLLLDEPLSALDPALKSEFRAELAEVLSGLQIPALMVTHDFEDAATLAGAIGVLVEGRLAQAGTAGELVAAPVDAFVASFTGANVLPGRARATVPGLTEVRLDTGETIYSVDLIEGNVWVVVYPWDVTVGRTVPEDSALNHIGAPLTSIISIGNRARVAVGNVVAEVTSSSLERLDLGEGQRAVASFKATATRLVSRAGVGAPPD